MKQLVRQISLPLSGGTGSSAATSLSEGTCEQRGAVFTRREVVDFMLDLVGYTADRPLYRMRLLEPSFGHGDFLLSAVGRLLESYTGSAPLQDLAAAIQGVEIHQASVEATRAVLRKLIEAHGHDAATAAALAGAWLVRGDFLLLDLPAGFTHVIGNPPYVRQEMIPANLLAEYRARYATIYDRADLYVPFFERGLDLLASGGQLGFICSDRWMKNKYGGPLRTMIAQGFHLSCYVDMVDTPAFSSAVIAYPAITVIARESGIVTRVAHRPEIDARHLSKLARALRGDNADGEQIEAERIAQGSEPWILHAPVQTALVRRLEKRFPSIEEAGCKIGIGVATGADKVFIAPYDELDVEPDRKLPLVTTKDIADGTIRWRGLGVINPFEIDGAPVALAAYPRLARYLESHGEAVRRRNIAKRSPHAWYRTIDRIFPELVARPKLLIPDIKGEANVVFDDGRYYPHHNLYYVVSDDWPLLALQAVLRSGIAKLFVAAYSVQMRGGHLRFQAQYLRRIRLPRWADLQAGARDMLVKAATNGDAKECDRLVFDVYGLTEEERTLIRTERE